MTVQNVKETIIDEWEKRQENRKVTASPRENEVFGLQVRTTSTGNATNRDVTSTYHRNEKTKHNFP